MTDLTKKTIDEFLKLTKVPRPSYHNERALLYLQSIADEKGYTHYRDTYGNFWMDVPATSGYENKPRVILQAHMDMVPAVIAGKSFDFENMPIKAIVNKDTITADGTTLGADDGIGIAAALAVCDASHGPIRILCTADEEVGMFGADALPMEALDADYLINIDSETVGEIVMSCAGSVRIKFSKDYELNDISDKTIINIDIKNLIGGHSGVEINENRLSCVTLFLKVLNKLDNFNLIDMNIGYASNGIADKGNITIAVNTIDEVKNSIEKVIQEIEFEYPKEKPSIKLIEKECNKAIGENESKNLLDFLNRLPQGVLTMSEVVDNLVETSNNIGIITLENGHLETDILERSSVNSEQDKLKDSLIAIAKKFDIDYSVLDSCYGWEAKKNYRLLDVAKDAYIKTYGKVNVIAIHAGLECAIFAGKCPDMEIISIGPTLSDVHTPKETVYLDTIEPMVNALALILENI